MGVLVLHHTLGDLAGEGISNRDIDVICGDREGFDQQSLNQQTGDDLPLFQSSLEVAMQRFEELAGKHHVGFNTKVATTGCEALHVLHLHAGQAGQLLSLIGDESAKGDVVVMSFLLSLDHDGVDPAVRVLVSLSGEVRQRILTLHHSCLRCVEGRHRTL